MAVDRDALLRLALATGEDEARVVFADWLEEQGEVTRAQLIHLQCEAAKLSPWSGRSFDIGWEVGWLLVEHADALRADLPAIEGVTFDMFERGFVTRICVRDPDRLAAVAAEVRRAAPIERVALESGEGTAPLPSWVKELELPGADLAYPIASQVESLVVCRLVDRRLDDLTLRDTTPLVHLQLEVSTNVGAAFVETLVKASWAKQLRTLIMPSAWVPVDVGYGEIDEDTRLDAARAKQLARLARLERLDIDRHDIMTHGLSAMLPKLTRLTRLSARRNRIKKLDALATAHGASFVELVLAENPIGSEGLATIAKAPRMTQLEALDVDTCEIEGYGVIELVRSPAWQSLRYLVLSRNRLGMAGARALAEAAAPAQLETLCLADVDLDANALNVLGKATWLGQLVKLDLAGNRMGPGIAALRAMVPDRLRSLNLDATGLARSEAAVIARFWPTLVHLTLGHGAFGDAGIERFAIAKPAAALQTLALHEGELTDDALELLARARMPRLRRLRLDGNCFGAAAIERLLGAVSTAKLEQLDLSRCKLDGKAIAAIARAPLSPRLRRLALRGNELEESDLVRLADSSSLPQLTRVEVDGVPWAYKPEVREKLERRFGVAWYCRDDEVT